MPMGHSGQFKTIEAIWKYYWWPRMHTFIRNYIAGYAICQQNKMNTHPTTPPLTPIWSSGGRPFATLTINFIMNLPVSNGKDLLLVMVDHGLTKGVVFIPCTKTFSILKTANLLLRHVYKRFGIPNVIISDREPQFASHTFREMGKLLEINLQMSMACHL